LWFRRKVIIIPVLVALVLVGSIAGVALAQDGSDSSGNTLLARVAAILGIDQTTVENAFAQAQKDMREEAMTNYLQEMVAEGKITQEEADQYQTWWDARPDALDKLGPGFEFGGCGRGFHHGGGGLWMAPDQSTQSTEPTQ
jgi:hypothetical protein